MHFALYIIHYSLCIEHFALCIVHCALCILHYALVIHINIPAEAGIDADAASTAGLGQEVTGDRGDAAAPQGHGERLGARHQLAVVVIEAHGHLHAALVAVDHDQVLGQGDGATLGRAIAHGREEADAGGRVERHATQHTIAVGKEAGIGHKHTQGLCLAEPLVVVGGHKAQLAHDALEREIAVDDGGGVALVDLELDGRRGGVGVALVVVAHIGRTHEADVGEVGGAVVEVGGRGAVGDIVGPGQQVVLARGQGEPHLAAQRLAGTARLVREHAVVLVGDGLHLQAQHRLTTCTRLGVIGGEVCHRRVECDRHDNRGRTQVGLCRIIVVAARGQTEDGCNGSEGQ